MSMSNIVKIYNFTWNKVLLISCFLFVACSTGAHAEAFVAPQIKTIYIDVRGIADSDRAAMVGLYTFSPAREVNMAYIGKVKFPGWGWVAFPLSFKKRIETPAYSPTSKSARGRGMAAVAQFRISTSAAKFKPSNPPFRFGGIIQNWPIC